MADVLPPKPAEELERELATAHMLIGRLVIALVERDVSQDEIAEILCREAS